jgi:ribosome maturation factor RimP
VSDALERLVSEELGALEYALVELRRGGSKARPLVEVRIERVDGAPVTVDDCANASRAIEARLDASDVLAERYVLQVSSPGDRPLRTAADWRRFVGHPASVLAPEHGGRFEAEVVGVEGDEGSETVVLQVGKKGEPRRVPLAAVKEARLGFRI